MRIDLKSRFITVWALFEGSIVAGKTDAGIDAAIELQGVNPCESPGLSPKDVSRMET